MKTKAIILAILFVTLAIFAQGWRNGQISQISNPTAQNCANTGCHGGTAPGAYLHVEVVSGNNQTWTQGTNAIIIQPIAATDTIGGGFSGDTTLRCWGYTMNFTSCTGGPLPISVSLHNCNHGWPLKYQSNGIWYVENTGNPPLMWQSIPGQPSNVRYFTSYCMAVFTIGPGYQDSIRINIGAVFSNCDSTQGGDSTVFYNSKLGYQSPLNDGITENEIMTSLPVNSHAVVNGVLYIKHRGPWRLTTMEGRAFYGVTEKAIPLAAGIYFLQIGLGKPKTIQIR